MADRLVDDASGDGALVCWSYTHARRHPSVLGKVGGAHLPFGPYTPTQGVIFLVCFGGLYLSREVWGSVIAGSGLRVVVLFGVPAAAMFIFRNLRIEGRSPLFFLFGVVTLVTAPRHGRLRGRRARRPGVRPLYQHSTVCTWSQLSSAGVDAAGIDLGRWIEEVLARPLVGEPLRASTALSGRAVALSAAAGGVVWRGERDSWGGGL